MSQYVAPNYNKTAFHCPLCGVYANQQWYFALRYENEIHSTYSIGVSSRSHARGVKFAECTHCKNNTIWLEGKMVYPFSGNAPLPNRDLPEDIRLDYEEARSIVNQSPRGAVALLRLAVQKLCKHLGERGENINEDIKSLVRKGLPEKMQKALDSVRVIGNNAVHPGQLDLRDDVETAIKLFAFINIICDVMITQPNQIDEFYELKIPESQRQAIERRDGRT